MIFGIVFYTCFFIDNKKGEKGNIKEILSKHLHNMSNKLALINLVMHEEGKLIPIMHTDCS